jgi:hypothetical protein
MGAPLTLLIVVINPQNQTASPPSSPPLGVEAMKVVHLRGSTDLFNYLGTLARKKVWVQIWGQTELEVSTPEQIYASWPE